MNLFDTLKNLCFSQIIYIQNKGAIPKLVGKEECQRENDRFSKSKT